MVDRSDRLWVGSMPDAYERWLVPSVFRPFAVDLASRVAAHSPLRLLELAAGTGVLTEELLAALPSADITATDLNDGMVEVGAAGVSGATWRQADALDLPFGDAEFDVVACQFGIMFFPDKGAAFAEVGRVLTRHGTFVANAWASVEEHDFQAAVVAGVERALPGDAPAFMVAVPHAYADVDAIVADVRAGGLHVASVGSVTLEGEAASAADLAAGYCLGTPLRAGIEERGDLAAVTAIVAEEIEARLGPGPIIGRMTAHVIEAVHDCQ